jgi:hypothetical protein
MDCAPVAQLDRAPGYEPVGRRFESFRAHHNSPIDKDLEQSRTGTSLPGFVACGGICGMAGSELVHVEQSDSRGDRFVPEHVFERVFVGFKRFLMLLEGRFR